MRVAETHTTPVHTLKNQGDGRVIRTAAYPVPTTMASGSHHTIQRCSGAPDEVPAGGAADRDTARNVTGRGSGSIATPRTASSRRTRSSDEVVQKYAVRPSV